VCKVPFFNEFVQLHGAEYGCDLVTVMLHGKNFSSTAVSGKEHLAHLNIADLRGIRIESPGHAIGCKRADRLVAMFHQDDAILVRHPRSSLRSNSEIYFAF